VNFDHNQWDWAILVASLVIGIGGICWFAWLQGRPVDDGSDENQDDC